MTSSQSLHPLQLIQAKDNDPAQSIPEDEPSSTCSTTLKTDDSISISSSASLPTKESSHLNPKGSKKKSRKLLLIAVGIVTFLGVCLLVGALLVKRSRDNKEHDSDSESESEPNPDSDLVQAPKGKAPTSSVPAHPINPIDRPRKDAKGTTLDDAEKGKSTTLSIQKGFIGDSAADEADDNAKISKLAKLIYAAVQAEDLKRLQHLFAESSKPNVFSWALNYYTHEGSTGLLTPLMLAASKLNAPLAKWLIEKGARLNLSDYEIAEMSPCYHALLAGDGEPDSLYALLVLLRNMTASNKVKKYLGNRWKRLRTQQTDPQKAAEMDAFFNGLPLTENRDYSLSVTNLDLLETEKRKNVIKAILNEDWKSFEEVLPLGDPVDVNLYDGTEPDRNFLTPLAYAAFFGNLKSAEYLLGNRKARPNTILSEHFHSALHMAAKKKNPEMIALLLQHGADPLLPALLHTDLHPHCYPWELVVGGGNPKIKHEWKQVTPDTLLRCLNLLIPSDSASFQKIVDKDTAAELLARLPPTLQTPEIREKLGLFPVPNEK